MAAVNFYQVTSYPASPVADAMYFLKRSGSKADLRLTDSTGAYYDIATDSKVLSTVITGLSIVNGAIVDTDTILAALGKSQGQINAINSSLTSVSASLTAHIANVSNPHSVTKSQVGLSNADNTSDTNKPVSTAQAAADAAILASAQTYADGLVIGLLDDRGNYDASGNVFPSSGGSGTAGAVMKGDLWTISVAGTLGGHPVTAGDVVRALTNIPGQTDANWAISETNIGYTAENSANKDASGGYAGLTLYKINFKNVLNTFTSFFTNANTASRTYTFQDRDGTIADGTDITSAKARANHTGTQLANTISNFDAAALAAAPAETNTTIGALINSATDKATPVDADYVGLMDSAASNVQKKLSWANAKATLKTYFDTIYGSGTGDMILASTQTVSGLKTFLAAKFALRNVANTFSGLFTNTNTADRTYTLQDRNGTLADDTDLAGKQPLDSDLTAIAALAPTNDDIIQRKSGAWTNRTMAQLKTDLSLTKSDVGLGNVDNTADTSKPVSTAQAAADAAILASAQTYADGLVVGLWDDRGSYDPTATSTYPASGGSGSAGAIKKGDIWTISVAGTIASITVQIGDTVRALTDTPGTTASNWTIAETNIGYVPENVASKDATGGYAGLTLFKINFKNVLNTFTSFFTNSNTAARTYTFQDRNGTIADDTDITAAKARANHTGTQLANTISNFDAAALAAAPAETVTTTGALINGATDKATPVDADYVGLMDSAASNVLKKLSWANIKATLKTYFDTQYTYNNVADFLIEPAVDQTAQGPRTNDLNAGATITIIDLLILDSSSKWQKTDANTSALYSGMLAMALAAGTNNNPLLVALKGSVIRNDAWAWTPGATLYMSETAGAITATQPTTADAAIRVIGFALTDDCIYFDPSPDFITHT